MLVRSILTAAVGSVLHHYREDKKTTADKKGKAAAVGTASGTGVGIATMSAAQRNYGSAGRLERPVSYSGSRSGERLDSVPEHLDDMEGESPWNDIQEGGSESCNEDGDEDWDNPPYDFRRSVRLYAIVPLGSALFLLFAALLPKLIAPKPFPSPPPLLRLILSAILSAALWCLAHQLRVPLYSTLHAILSGLTKALSFIFNFRSRNATHRHLSPIAAAYIVALTSIIHVLALAFLQESLRIASFAISNLHWYQSNGPPTSTRHPRSHDAAFSEVWVLALGWALAEVCAGVIQGYEQLALYTDFGNPSRRTSEGGSKSGDEVLTGNGVNNSAVVIDEEAVDMVRWSMPCVGLADDEDVEGAKNMTQIEIDSALARLANLRARDELEELYGQPYIEIPVFVALLQRLDSILISLGNTLLLAAAYLPLPPHASSLSTFASNPTSSSLSRESPSHTHMLPLVPTFFIVALVHAALGVLHGPHLLARVGIPAAAYASCIVGLGLTFAGVGVWIGLW